VTSLIILVTDLCTPSSRKTVAILTGMGMAMAMGMAQFHVSLGRHPRHVVTYHI